MRILRKNVTAASRLAERLASSQATSVAGNDHLARNTSAVSTSADGAGSYRTGASYQTEAAQILKRALDAGIVRRHVPRDTR